MLCAYDCLPHKETGAFQHSSFTYGGVVTSAGLISVKRGLIYTLSPLSGHYRYAHHGYAQTLSETLTEIHRTSVDVSGNISTFQRHSTWSHPFSTSTSLLKYCSREVWIQVRFGSARRKLLFGGELIVCSPLSTNLISCVSIEHLAKIKKSQDNFISSSKKTLKKAPDRIGQLLHRNSNREQWHPRRSRIRLHSMRLF